MATNSIGNSVDVQQDGTEPLSHNGTIAEAIRAKLATERVMSGPRTIVVAGKRILAMPLGTLGLTPEQQRDFEKAGGLINPSPTREMLGEMNGAMMEWTESFEQRYEKIDGTFYGNFELFKKVYEAFPHIHAMSKEEAIEAGLYPTIRYRNFAARKWIAENLGGRLALLDEDYTGELLDICEGTSGSNAERLAILGQAPLGARTAGTVYGLGVSAFLGSGSLDHKGRVRALNIPVHGTEAHDAFYDKNIAISNIIVFDK